MAGINIPGVTDQYNTTETVEKLMQIERIPLNREQKTLEAYKNQQDAWRSVNRKVTSLRDSVKSLYSFENPFNNKITSSTEENAITAEATRKATYESFKIDVIQPASADRFLSSELEADTKVPAGTYTYKIADKTISMRWKGGSLQDFSNALNRRGGDTLKTRVIGASKGMKTFSIESQKTGAESKLIFEDDAKTFAESSGMIVRVKPKTIEFGNNRSEFRPSPSKPVEQQGLPAVSISKISVSDGKTIVPPRNGFSIDIPELAKENKNSHIQFSVQKTEVEDITEELNKVEERPVFPESGSVTFKDVTIFNSAVDASLPPLPSVRPAPIEQIKTDDVLFAVMSDGSERNIPLKGDLNDEIKIDLNLSDYKGISSIVLRNRNTGASYSVSPMTSLNPDENLGFIPQHPVTTADDAIIKYEGITLKRPENTIDDVIPEVTLNIHEKTEKTATISVKPDTEAAKDALIEFVGKYNQALSELNILSQNKPEIVEELDYLTEDEKKEYREKLGMFTADSSISNLKNSMISTAAAPYKFSDSAEISMLSQIGIATNATNYSGYTPSKLRGYLEIDEKKLDAELEKNLEDIKNIFGFDSDGDLIIDRGIGYQLDKQLTSYVQSGGIFSMKTSSLDSKIKASEQKISRLENQMNDKEADLKNKYGRMQGALNSLENQQTTIKNFSNRGNNN